MHKASDNQDHIVDHVTVGAEIQEIGQRSVSMSSHMLPCVRKPPSATIYNCSGVQGRSLIHKVWAVICACLQTSIKSFSNLQLASSGQR